jgi:dipeptidyl aminopeptidase/acylaminoacyl peptidase
MDASPSPNGDYILTEAAHRPFSYLVPAYRFPKRIAVLDAQSGDLVKEIADLPLAEDVPVAFGSVRKGVRSAEWRADAPATLAWTEALDEGDAGQEADERDRLYTLEAPFDGEPTSLATLPLRYGGVTWGDDDLALVSEYWFATRKTRTYAVAPGDPGSSEAAEPKVLFDYSYENRYDDPGSPLTEPTGNGTRVLKMSERGDLFLTGSGASPEGDRPFLRIFDPESGETEELFRSEAPFYESPVDLLDADERILLTRRETATERPNYFRRNLRTGEATQLTDFAHPYPALADVQKKLITYERADGVQLTATLYLPADYDAEEDGPLPGLLWAYPQEYKSADAAGQVSGSPHAFKWLSYWGAVPYVTQGYAVLDDASMPIIGEGKEEPNDTFREQLVAGARAAIEEGARRGVLDPDRVGVGGHSYGAFMVANLLAHSDLFEAGIARSGAYNRSLTPFGFQREERTFWEAPEVYFSMSPFMHVDDVDDPLLLIHGQEDNNSGTYPMQSERYYNALKGLGKTTRLVMLPEESHGYRARESVLHMLWEMNRWLDTYVKNGGDGVASSEEGGEARGER